MTRASTILKAAESGRRAERRAARDLGAKMIPQSGGGSSKGDFVVGEILVEHKATRNKSYSLKLADLVKIVHEALMTGRKPMFMVTFEDHHGTPRDDGRYVVMPVEVFNGLCLGENKRR